MRVDCRVVMVLFMQTQVLCVCTVLTREPSCMCLLHRSRRTFPTWSVNGHTVQIDGQEFSAAECATDRQYDDTVAVAAAAAA